MTAVASRHYFQTEITPDAVLQMHDEIAVVQVGKINVERGTRGQRVGGFLAARPLDFVATKNLRVGDDGEFHFLADKTTGERSDLYCRCIAETEFLPDFLKALPLAVVVAENVNRIILTQPAVKLLEKFASLRLGDLRLRRAFA